MIPSYPGFRPLDKSDRELFEESFRENPPQISEYTFTNIYAWRQIYKFQVSLLDGFIILRSDKKEEQQFFSPIGKGDIKKIITEILEDSRSQFVRLPEEVKAVFDNDKKFKSEFDPDNSDYLFAAGDLVNLRGRKYDGKRNLIKKFKAAYSYEYVKLQGYNVKECLEFEEDWCGIKDCDSTPGLGEERYALREMLENFSDFHLIAGAIKVKSRMSALALAQALNPDTLVMHILKANPEMAGLYQIMNNEFLSRESSGFTYVNLEQDLGVEGLRKTKLSYHPLRMIKKYTLRLV